MRTTFGHFSPLVRWKSCEGPDAENTSSPRRGVRHRCRTGPRGGEMRVSRTPSGPKLSGDRFELASQARPWAAGSKLALRRGEVLDALGISEETFDRHVRPYLPVVRLGTVRLYPLDGLDAFLAGRATAPAEEVEGRAA